MRACARTETQRHRDTETHKRRDTPTRARKMMPCHGMPWTKSSSALAKKRCMPPSIRQRGQEPASKHYLPQPPPVGIPKRRLTCEAPSGSPCRDQPYLNKTASHPCNFAMRNTVKRRCMLEGCCVVVSAALMETAFISLLGPTCNHQGLMPCPKAVTGQRIRSQGTD